MALVLSRDSATFLNDGSIYDQIVALSGIEMTILSYVVPVNEKHVLLSVIIGGNDKGQFIIRINGTEELRIRNAWTSRTKEISLGDGHVNAGDSITVSVINDGDVSNIFEARLNIKKL